MKRTGMLLSLGLALCVVGPVVMAGEHAGGAEKLRIVSVADAPDPWSPVLTELSVVSTFEARPTDAGGGNEKNEKSFAIRVTVQVAGEAGGVVRQLAGGFAFQFPEKLPANQYHGVAAVITWDGKDDAGVLVPDGSYTYTVQGTLVRIDILGNGKVQEHSVGTSGALSAAVTVDSASPQITDMVPAADTYVTEKKPKISASFSDEVGVDVARTEVKLDEKAVTPDQLSDAGFEHTPKVDLAEDDHTVEVTIYDFAGNSDSESATWKVDTVPPDITNLQPPDGAVVLETQPELSAQFTDAISKVNPASLQVTLTREGQAVQIEMLDSGTWGFSARPVEPQLPDGFVLEVSIADKAGNASQASSAFTVLHEPVYEVGPDAEFATPQDAVDTMVAVALLQGGVLTEDVSIRIYADTYQDDDLDGAVLRVPGDAFDPAGHTISIDGVEDGVVFQVQPGGIGIWFTPGVNAGIQVRGAAVVGGSGTGYKIEMDGTYVFAPYAALPDTFSGLDVGVEVVPGVTATVTVDQAAFTNCAQRGISSEGYNVLWDIRGNTTFDVCGTAVYQTSSNDLGGGTISGCVITDCTSTAIDLRHNSGWAITGNEIAWGLGDGIHAGYGSYSYVIEGNFVHDNAGTGIASSDLMAAVDICGNRIIDNGVGFYGHANFYNNLVRTEVGDGLYLVSLGTYVGEIYNNTIHVTLGGCIRGWSTSHPTISNNILIATGPISYCYELANPPSGGHNDYVLRDGAKLGRIIDAVYDGLQAWQDAGGDATSISEDPLFVDDADPVNFDYRLQASSPCIDAANGDRAPEFDIEGRPRHDDPNTEPNTGTGTPDYADMGAYEHLPEYDPPTIVISPADGSVLGYPSVSIEVDISDPSDVDLASLAFDVAFDPDGDGPLPMDPLADINDAELTDSHISYTRTYDVLGLAGQVDVTVFAADVLGNSVTATSTFAIQTGAPQDPNETAVWITGVTEEAGASLIVEDDVYYTNGPTMTVDVQVQNADTGWYVSVGGASSGPHSGTTASVQGVRLFEGENALVATLSAPNGVAVSPEESVTLDTEGPVLSWSSPSEPTTECLGFLYLNNDSDDSTRRVYKTTGFQVQIQAVDDVMGLSSPLSKCHVRDFAAYWDAADPKKRDDEWPFYDYAMETDLSAASWGSEVGTAGVSGNIATFSGFTGGMSDDKTQAYAVRFTVADELGNASSLVMFCKYDGTLPELLDVGDDPEPYYVRWNTFVWAKATEPIYSFTGGTKGKKYDYGKLYVDSKVDRDSTSSDPDTFTSTLTDLAGNTGEDCLEVWANVPGGMPETNADVVLKEDGHRLDLNTDYPHPYGDEYTLMKGDELKVKVFVVLYTEDPDSHEVRLDDPALGYLSESEPAPTGETGLYYLNVVQTEHAVDARWVRCAEEEEPPAPFIAVRVVDPTLGQPFFGLPHPLVEVNADGLAARGMPADFSFTPLKSDEARVGDQTFQRTTEWASDAGTTDLPDGCFVDAELFDQTSVAEGQWIIAHPPTDGGAEVCKGRLYNVAGECALPGGTRTRKNRPGRRPVGHDISLTGGGLAESPHKAILVEVWPHNITQMTKKVWIRGWFGDNKVGQSGTVVFKKPDGSATVTASSAVVVIDDPVNRDIVQAIECEVDFSEVENPEGLWDVEVECGEVHGTGPVKFYGMPCLISVLIDVDRNGSATDPVDRMEDYLPGYCGEEAIIPGKPFQGIDLIVNTGDVIFDSIKVSIRDATHYKGYCTNAGAESETRWDVSLDAGANQATTELPFAGQNTASIPFVVRDYGAWAKFRVELAAIGRTWKFAYFTLPVDEDGDKMADAWEEYVSTLGTDLSNTYDSDKRTWNRPPRVWGDGIVAIDEYRGFMTGHDGDAHVRTDPHEQDLFVRVDPALRIPWSTWEQEIAQAFQNLGCNMHWVGPNGYMNLPGPKRFLCFNGDKDERGNLRSAQRVVLVKKQYEGGAYARTTADGYVEIDQDSDNNTPASAGNVFLDLDNVMAPLSQAGKANVAKHEGGHNCGLRHHYNPGGNKDSNGRYCVMGCMGSQAVPGKYEPGEEPRGFCEQCKKRMKVH